MTDFISLPFYDLLQENGHVPEIRTKLPPLLAGVRRSILEIGAGTGLITTSLTGWTPAEIFALEPSAGMRALLVSRLSSRPELLKRVTVLPCDALSVDLDEPVEPVVMINVMYALEPDYRRGSGRCWRLSWPPPGYWSSPGALVVRRRPVRSRGWIRVRWAGICKVLSEILESDEEAFRDPVCTGSSRARRSLAKRRSSATPSAPDGT